MTYTATPEPSFARKKATHVGYITAIVLKSLELIYVLEFGIESIEWWHFLPYIIAFAMYGLTWFALSKVTQ